MARYARVVLWLIVVAAGSACGQDRTIYEKASAYNYIVVTEDPQGLRTLWFEKNGARQSVVKPGDADYIELPYARAMLGALALVEEPRRMLIVGLGGGTLPGFLHKHYPQATIDVVDIDPAVVEVAKQFFAFREDETLRVHVADGRRFIEQCRDPYDIIFLDAFSAENIPYHLATQEFLRAVRQAIKPGGVVAANIWSREWNPLHDSMVRTYQEVFFTLLALDVRDAGNEILLGFPSRVTVGREELARKATALSQRKQLPLDLGEVIRFGIRPTTGGQLDGQVLRDADAARKAG